MDLYGQLLHNVKQFIPQVNMAPGLARNARGPRLLTMMTPCRCLDGYVKEPYEMSMALGAPP